MSIPRVACFVQLTVQIPEILQLKLLNIEIEKHHIKRSLKQQQQKKKNTDLFHDLRQHLNLLLCF